MTKSAVASASALALLVILCLLFTPHLEAEESGRFTEPLVRSLDQAGRKLVALAEEIPAERYSWRPTPEVRSVSEVLIHVAVGNFQLPASIGGGAPDGVEVPGTVWEMTRQRKEWEAEIVDKPAVVDLLRRSFAYAAEAVPAIDDLDLEVATWGFRSSKRDYLLILQSHAHEHLGQTIAYARGLGITPPWSRRREPAAAPSVAVFDGSTASAELTSIDDFGNLLTNFVRADFERLGISKGEYVVVEACGGSVEALYGNELFDVHPEEWIAFVRPDGHLAIAVSYGSAAEGLGCTQPGTIVVQPTD